MGIKYNSSDVKVMKFNGNKVKRVIYNGVKVFDPVFSYSVSFQRYTDRVRDYYSLEIRLTDTSYMDDTDVIMFGVHYTTSRPIQGLGEYGVLWFYLTKTNWFSGSEYNTLHDVSAEMTLGNVEVYNSDKEMFIADKNTLSLFTVWDKIAVQVAYRKNISTGMYELICEILNPYMLRNSDAFYIRSDIFNQIILTKASPVYKFIDLPMQGRFSDDVYVEVYAPSYSQTRVGYINPDNRDNASLKRPTSVTLLFG